MATPRQRPSSPSNPDDQSTVRQVSQPPPPFAATSPRERLEGKLRTARELLDRLPASDERARLLQVAVMRRDEALLDGVLSALGVYVPTVPPASR
ncbi:MAG TPA: hypothetical protein VMI54_31285 [Polyangiaceae bacterium]|nr:hypothetical protein [Polyangiaceae bacterium]